MPAAELLSILSMVARGDGAEVTVECNPETVTAELMRAYREAGVNRVSFGVQSMVAHVLTSLGREHRVETVAAAVALAADAGLTNYNVDLIFGAAGESIADWQTSLDGVLALDPSPAHVSAYALTVENGTPLAADRARHPDDDDQADKYVIADERLTAAGFANYEVSNWARAGQECRHNLLYWSQGNYRGIGCAAHSHADDRRWWNVRTPERYIDAIASGASPVGGEETLDADHRAVEGAQLALRTRTGVPADALADDDKVELEAAGLINCRAGRVVLTARGRLLTNEVALRLRG